MLTIFAVIIQVRVVEKVFESILTQSWRIFVIRKDREVKIAHTCDL